MFDQDIVLKEAVEREGGPWGLPGLSRFGEVTGGESLRLGAVADRNPPVLRTHDRFGHRVDEIEFHPPGSNCSASASWRRSPRSPGETAGPAPTWFAGPC